MFGQNSIHHGNEKDKLILNAEIEDLIYELEDGLEIKFNETKMAQFLTQMKNIPLMDAPHEVQFGQLHERKQIFKIIQNLIQGE